MQTFLLDPRRFEDAVVASAEVDRARVFAMLVGDERCVLTEVPLRAQIEDCIHGSLIEWHVTLARCTLELADLDLSAAGELHTVAPGDFLHAALEMQHSVVEIDVAVEQAEHLRRCIG